MGQRILVVDNYDSFVYILAQYLGEMGAEPVVRRNDAIDVAGARALNADGVLISPGPGRPEDAGVSNALIAELGARTPVFGVCLGLQCIGAAYGAIVRRAPRVMHGKTSQISHDGKGVFDGIDSPLTATRYHSLIVEQDSVPDELSVTATSEDGLIMGLRHKTLPVEGVQFHPESILTDAGHALLANFLSLAR